MRLARVLARHRKDGQVWHLLLRRAAIGSCCCCSTGCGARRPRQQQRLIGPPEPAVLHISHHVLHFTLLLTLSGHVSPPAQNPALMGLPTHSREWRRQRTPPEPHTHPRQEERLCPQRTMGDTSSPASVTLTQCQVATSSRPQAGSSSCSTNARRRSRLVTHSASSPRSCPEQATPHVAAHRHGLPRQPYGLARQPCAAQLMQHTVQQHAGARCMHACMS